MTLVHLPPLLALLTTYIALSSTAAPYCFPGNPCFPSKTELENFNATVNGRLIRARPYGAACYKKTYDMDACAALAGMKGNFTYRGSLPAGLMYTNWEQDGKLGCPVPDLLANGDSPPPVDTDCTLGGMSSYVVNVTSTDDIVKSVKFASKYNLRFRIKNTGHDYNGRSSSAGAFSVWTRYMNEVKLVKNFRPCHSSNPQDVISAGPGVNVEELYALSGKNDLVTMGGYTATVGAAGGWVLGGGVGPLGHFLGMGVDNVVQFEVVTADAEKRTVNECSNTDLWWALRGGGGTFAVVTRVYFKTYAAYKAVNTLAGQVVCTNKGAYSELVGRLVDIQLPMRRRNQTGIWAASSSHLAISLLSIRPFTNSVLNITDSLEAHNSILTIPGCVPNVQTAQFLGLSSFNDAYQTAMWPIISAGGEVGLNIADFSRLISNEMIQSPKKLKNVKEYILNLSSGATFIWQNSVGDASQNINVYSTSVHEDWRSAFAFMDVSVTGPWSGVTKAQTALAQTVVNNATDVFGTTAYYNEDWILEKDWQKSFFGEQYARLLKIKRKVDPKGVFSCRQCVGSENGY